MIAGIGIDTVTIKRFNHWSQFSYSRLQRIFAAEEIDYCMSNVSKTSERFAARFAAKEAFYKALSPIRLQNIPFFTLSTKIIVRRDKCGIHLIVDWQFFVSNRYMKHDNFKTHISITHTDTNATAVIVIEDPIFSIS